MFKEEGEGRGTTSYQIAPPYPYNMQHRHWCMDSDATQLHVEWHAVSSHYNCDAACRSWCQLSRFAASGIGNDTEPDEQASKKPPSDGT